jgi:hypothetical protein
VDFFVLICIFFKITIFFIFYPEFTSDLGKEEGQQVNVTDKIFHFEPEGVHAYIQVLIF